MNLFHNLRKSAFPRRFEAHNPSAPILEISHLSVAYDQLRALDQVSFHLHAGERVAVIGPNGAGKSTLFKVIAGVLTPSQGEVKVYGHTPGRHICIAYLPQRSQVDWNFPVSVADVVMMGRISQLGPLRWPSRGDWELVRHSLEVVGLQALMKRQIGALSGGQQQRMFVARALAQQAELMLMDEPFTGLDGPSSDQILEILGTLQAQGVTVMASTHDLNLAGDRFDRVMLLNRRLIGFGRPEQVFTPERLLAAYGGRLRLLQANGQTLALGDTCCEDEEGGHEHLA